MLDFNKIKTIPISNRKNLFNANDMASPDSIDDNGLSDNKDLKELGRIIANASGNGRQIIFMIGGHVIKTGMSLFIIELLKKGIIKHIAMNGAACIHDFEIAMIGATSEDVAKTIEDGTFGMAEETGRCMNDAINKSKEGFGKAIGMKIDEMNLSYKEKSILYWCNKLNIPATAHVAIGTDIIHQHPGCSGEATGRATYHDFRLFTDSVSRLEQGVVVNIGSAVIMPEVFLKVLTIARNLGFRVEKITAANLDMIDHYRPRVNVVERPTSLGGRGLIIIDKHEKNIPGLYKQIIGNLNEIKRGEKSD